MDIRDRNQMRVWSPPQIPELVSPGIVVRGGKTVIFGEEKLGKSILAQQLGYCLSSGSAWVGFTTAMTSAIVLQAEIPPKEFKDRFLLMDPHFPPGQFLGLASTLTPPKMDVDQGFKELLAICQKYHPQVLILDPLYRFISIIEPLQLSRFYDRVDSLLSQFSGMSIIVVAHSRKKQHDDKGNIIHSGPNDLWGPRSQQWYFDSIIELRGDPSVIERTLHFTLRHARSYVPPKLIRLNHSKLLFEF